jgi:hypothetical protein
VATNRYYRGDPYRGDLYKPPVEFIANALEKAQKTYDSNFVAAEGLKNKYIQTLPQDRARANELQKQFETKVDDVVSKYGYDSSAASKELYKLQTELAKQYGPGGEAGAMTQNYSMVQDSLKRERERLAKGEITQTQFQVLQNHYNKFGGTKLDPTTGTYSQAPITDLAQYIDDSKIFEETLAKVKPRTIERAFKTGRKVDGQWEYMTRKEQFIDPNEVSTAFSQNLLGDDKFSNYVSQLAQMTGSDPNAILNEITNKYTQDIIPSRTGLMEDSRKLDYKDDWRDKENLNFAHQKALEQIRLQNRLKVIQFKEELGSEGANGPVSSYLTLTKAGNNAFKPLPLTEKVDSSGKPLSWMQTEWWTGKSEKPMDVNRILSEGRAGVNIPLLQSIKDANPTAPSSDLLRMYNQHVGQDQNFSRIDYNRYETTGAQREDFQRLVPELLQGNREIVQIDRATGNVVPITDQDTRIELAKLWADPKRKDMAAIGKTSSHSGHVPVGTLMPDPTGNGNYYVVKENRNDLINLQSEVLDKAFKFIQDDSRREGDIFELNLPNGKKQPLVGRKEYINGYQNIVYYEVSKTGPDTYVTHYDKPLMNGSRIATTKELEDVILPYSELKTTYPHKTKSQYESEFINE